MREDVIEQVIKPVVPADAARRRRPSIYINPTGRFVIGGPQGDTGLTGRKIIVDTYGGAGRHGGGAFSGKDPTKVDRSACYMARYIAKNIVAAGLADRVERAARLRHRRRRPGLGHGRHHGHRPDRRRSGSPSSSAQHFPLTPQGIIEYLDLRRPIFRKTAAYGHFGRNDPDFTWEKTDRAAALRSDAGI